MIFRIAKSEGICSKVILEKTKFNKDLLRTALNECGLTRHATLHWLASSNEARICLCRTYDSARTISQPPHHPACHSHPRRCHACYWTRHGDAAWKMTAFRSAPPVAGQEAFGRR